MQARRRQVELWWYVPIADRALPPEQQSRFRLSPLSQAERLRMLDDMSWLRRSDGEVIIQSRANTVALELVRDHLEETGNFPATAPAPWPASGTAAERVAYLEQFDDEVLIELAMEIRRRSVLEPDEKN
jgi:hypothetical protein